MDENTKKIEVNEIQSVPVTSETEWILVKDIEDALHDLECELILQEIRSMRKNWKNESEAA